VGSLAADLRRSGEIQGQRRWQARQHSRLFVSMAGFDDNQLEHFLQMPRGGRNNVILVDAQDLIAIFEGRITLPDALIAKIDAAEQEGRPWYPVRR
jgi:hypothetical protein